MKIPPCALALLLAGSAACRLLADEKTAAHTTVPQGTIVLPADAYPQAQLGGPVGPGCASGNCSCQDAGTNRRHPIKDCLRKCHLCCWESFNEPTCGSLKSECIFLFGSCRQFYCESCYSGPPQVPGAPPGVGYDRKGCCYP